MPATDVKFGITRLAGALIESVETEDKIEESVLKGSDGLNARVKVHNPTYSFSVTGHGALVVTLGFCSSGISGLSGGVQTILSIKKTEKNDGWDGWSYSGNGHPNAQQVN